MLKRKSNPFIDLEEVKEKTDLEKNIQVLGNDLTFANVPEYKRTKHVHRLHPYLGKFIPQLVEAFLRKYFKSGQTILDPFCGSGTTLVEANVLGMNSIGIELSSFNCLISRVKTRKYDLELVEWEVKDILQKLKTFSGEYKTRKGFLFRCIPEFRPNSEYLNTWFAKRSLQEILYYRSQIRNYEYQDVLKIILNRSARSARLIPHYDLARPKKPVRGPYYCIKHKRWCKPVAECLKFINRYSLDTIKRIREFDKISSEKTVKILQGDARTINLDGLGETDGIFTSPPYVGMIDYHEQHRYAYELFDFPRNDEKEIGPMSNGRGSEAREKYKKDIISSLKNMNRILRRGSKVFIVVNGRYNLYPDIATECGYALVDVFHRPVLMRTERDSAQYFESIYYMVKE